MGLIRVGGQSADEESTRVLSEDVETDVHGKYAFGGIAPGRYKIVVHDCCFPTPEVPYPAIYWPDASTEAAASEIEVGNAVVSRRCDFHLPPEVGSKLVSGLVLLPDGKPAVGVRIQILKLPENAITDYDSTVDAAGRFSFAAMEGLEYSLTAIGTGSSRMASAPVHVSAGKGPQPVILVLDGPAPFSGNR